MRKFFSKCKSEWLSHFGTFDTVDQTRLAVFEYIEGYYFNARHHQGLNYRTPTPRKVGGSYFEKLTLEAVGV